MTANNHSSAPDEDPPAAASWGAQGLSLAPLPGELGIPNVATKQQPAISKKALLALVLLLGLLVVVSGASFQRWVASGKKPGDADTKTQRDKPAAALAEPRRLDMPTLPLPPPVAATATPTGPAVPALLPTASELAEPIGVRRTGTGAVPGAGVSASGQTVTPQDAPVLLVSARLSGVAASPTPSGAAEPTDPNDALTATTRNLQGYQRQLQGLMETLTQSATKAAGGAASGAPETGPAAPAFAPAQADLQRPGVGAPVGATAGATTGSTPSPPAGPAAPAPSLFGGQLAGSATPRVAAAMLGNRSLILPKGTAFTCALKTKVVTATSGLVGCQVQRNVYSDDGRVLLVERGSHLDGEYRTAAVRPGTVRIPVLWTRIRTPQGVTVDLESPATGPLGESGIDGYVDNRWLERLGAAMLLSLIDDSVKLVIQNQSSDGPDNSQGSTVVLPSTTANSSKLAEKVLDSTINIPPLIYQNQGGIVGIYVARDVDFSAVYELRPVAR
jgi:type IV secretion system protein VirB10